MSSCVQTFDWYCTNINIPAPHTHNHTAAVAAMTSFCYVEVRLWCVPKHYLIILCDTKEHDMMYVGILCGCLPKWFICSEAVKLFQSDIVDGGYISIESHTYGELVWLWPDFHGNMALP
jgi:hypothetical protein